ncbi:MAG: diadenylate cyclase CdaA [Marinifilaceae bacterium]|nr:diadenylate cyclase CdaA [Marinifilaceae bacterium]
MFDFLSFGLFDIIDILLVATIFFIGYRLVRGTVAARIFVGVFTIYLFWILAEALNMQLVSSIVGQFISVGVLALLIVFQQEVRKFLLMIGSHYKWRNLLNPKSLFKEDEIKQNTIKTITSACNNLSKTKTGALIVITKQTFLEDFINTGVKINAEITQELIENVFFKNTPLHDGAMIIDQDRIVAARCILPVSDRLDIPGSMGLRHRAALGLSATTDALVIVVSEETGKISIFYKNQYVRNVQQETLQNFLANDKSMFEN